MSTPLQPTAPRLQLVPNADVSASFEPPPCPSIWVAPFRPGELPLTSWIPFRQETRDAVGQLASDAGLPVELWVRIAVEASRLLSEIASLSGESKAIVASVMNLTARERPREREDITAEALRRYATELEDARPGGPAHSEIAVRLPEEMAGAWSRSASEARLSLVEWVNEQLVDIPADCVAWEAAAAAACQSLGEWAYASWLRASASAKA